MTIPIPPSGDAPLEIPSVTSAAVRGIIENADRLGLKWQLLLGTVSSFAFTSNIASVIVDGDSNAVGAKSMIGVVVQAQRVYVLKVPPAGYFVIGIVGSNRIGVRLARFNTQSILNNTFTSFIWDTQYEDTNDYWTSGDTVRIPAGLGAVYAITASASSAGSGPAVRKLLNLTITSSLPGMTANFRDGVGVGESDLSVSAVIPLAAGDSYTILVWHNTGSTQTWNATLAMYRMRD
jgi:hypothetical protein